MIDFSLIDASIVDMSAIPFKNKRRQGGVQSENQQKPQYNSTYFWLEY
jgi:hypothetical protein